MQEVRLVRADLTDAEISGADLTSANLADAVLLRANLRESDLSNADLTGADLTAADLTMVNLTGAKLAGARLGATIGLNRPPISATWDRRTVWPEDLASVALRVSEEIAPGLFRVREDPSRDRADALGR